MIPSKLVCHGYSIFLHFNYLSIRSVEEILSRTPPATLQKLYSLPEFTSTLEFLTMMALSSGRLLKVRLSSSLGSYLFMSYRQGGTPDILGAARHVLQDWNHQKIPYYSEPPTVHPSQIPSVGKSDDASRTVPSSHLFVWFIVATSLSAGLTIAPGAENVGQAKILTEYSKPFELEGFFGAADAGAFDDVKMDEDGDVWFDAEEGMDEDQ